ncbi:hypothetical protein C8Q79DRAFT_904359 [Trametes meyenii]|nr:hypothetical protein C8Q79DRAFT_904359 [Trametes meyenii]
MSISTGSIYSGRSWSTSAALKVNQLEPWRREIQDKINIYDGNLDDYLKTFVPSRTPCPLREPPGVSASLAQWSPQKGHEVQSYPLLIDTLKSTVSSFPDDKRLSFFNSYLKYLAFPFSAFAEDHHKSRPDIAVSFPGDALPERLDQFDWSRFSMVIEVKATEEEDPFRENGSMSRADTLVQLAVNARSLLFAHGFLAAFAIGIYGEVVRIVRFDHSCAVASKGFHLKSSEGLKVLRDFFWRFVHPWEGVGPQAVVGCDATLRKLSSADTDWLKNRLGDESEEILEGVDLSEGRVVQLWDDGNTTQPTSVLLFKLIDVNARLFSRSTMVWLGIEYNENDSEHTDGEVELRIVKESWRQIIRIPEKTFYDRLSEVKRSVPDDEWVGLPEILHGGDLGIRDVDRWRRACSGEQWLGDGDLSAASVPTPDASATYPSSLSAPDIEPLSTRESPQDADVGVAPPVDSVLAPSSGDTGDIPYPMHQTWSWRLTNGENCRVYERSHVRFMVDTVGRPLSRFKSTRELVTAMRDAIRGHRLAMERGGILHRDVSSGNILIVDRPRRNHPCTGILHDFDYSSMTLSPPEVGNPAELENSLLYPLELSSEIENVAEFKERTGTYYFIALELMNPGLQAPAHLIRHDLESFFWVLVWIVLRHTNHDDPEGMKSCGAVFPYGNDRRATDCKTAWVNRFPAVKVKENEPLSVLLDKFGHLVDHATKGPRHGPQIPLTYDAILQVFDEVLARNDWPVDDKAIPFVRENTRTASVYGGNVIRLKGAQGSGTLGKRTHGEHITGSEVGSDLMSGSMPLRSIAHTMDLTKPQKRRKGSSASVLGGDPAGPSSSAVASGSNPPVTDDPPTRESSPTPAPRRRSTRPRGRGSKTTSGAGKASGGRRSRGSGARRAPGA